MAGAVEVDQRPDVHAEAVVQHHRSGGLVDMPAHEHPSVLLCQGAHDGASGVSSEPRGAANGIKRCVLRGRVAEQHVGAFREAEHVPPFAVPPLVPDGERSRGPAEPEDPYAGDLRDLAVGIDREREVGDVVVAGDVDDRFSESRHRRDRLAG